MTTPKVNTIKRGDSRFYVEPDSGEKAPGVTSIINMLPKGFLPRWAAKSTAEWTVENLGAVVGLALNDGPAAIDLMKGAPWRDTRDASRIGTEVHDLYERIAGGENVGRVHPDLAPYVTHFHEFLEEFSPEFLFLEETVWSKEHNYAGTFDALMVINGETVWTDWKTTRSGVHAEVALQLAAYSHADYIVRADGTKVPLPQAGSGAVFHVRPEGWSLVPTRVDDEVFSYFLALREVFNWNRDVSMTVLGKSLNANPQVNKRGQRRANF